MFFIKKAIKNPLLFVLLLAVVLIFGRFSYGGMIGDDAVYATRSIGLLDFMFAKEQPTPLQFFDKLPWWAYFSNHDHPPLLFWLSHFFLLFGQSIFWAKFLYGLLGILTVFVFYLWLKQETTPQAALWGALLLVLNPLFVWFSKVTFLEGGVIFFLVLALYCLGLFIKNKKHWFYFGLSLGALLLTKYTALFVLPVVLFYFFLQKRDFFKSKELYKAFFLALAVASPVILYNLFMYKSTGHFDLQWSGLFHQNSPWKLDRNLVDNYQKSFFDLGSGLAHASGFLYIGLSVLALLYFLGKGLYKRRSQKPLFSSSFFLALLSTLVLLVFVGMVIGSELRFLTLFLPFLAVFLAYFYKETKTNLLARAFWMLFAAYQFFFAVNTLLFPSPWGREDLTYASLRLKDYGVYALDSYLDDLLDGKRVKNLHDFYKKIKRKSPHLARYKLENNFRYKSGQEFYPIFVWDPNINWFSSVWLFERRRFYDNLPFLNAWEFQDLLKKQGGVGNFYFIKVISDGPTTTLKHQQKFGDIFEKQLQKEGAEVVNIYRADGQIAFKIYKK